MHLGPAGAFMRDNCRKLKKAALRRLSNRSDGTRPLVRHPIDIQE